MKKHLERIDKYNPILPHEVCETGKIPKSLDERMIIPIDKKIWPLVRILNLKNIPTRASCEGHSKHGFPYPWINSFVHEVNYDKIEKLKRVIGEYNSKNKIHWNVTLGLNYAIVDCFTLKPIIEKPLKELQKTIPSLTKYIENYL